MTYNPTTLQALGAYWVSMGGVNLGVVGDASHTAKGVSYHLGKDLLAADAYSARTARDKAGLTNAASAIDLGQLDGSLASLYKFSQWFAQRCFDGKPGYNDIREVIFWSTSRNRVVGWSDLAPGQWINDYGDLSHKTHTHISFYRDSEYRDKIPMFSPYFGAEMSISTRGLILSSSHVVVLPSGTPIYAQPQAGAAVLGKVSGEVPYFGSPAQGWKAVRVSFSDGSLIAYTTSAASVVAAPTGTVVVASVDDAYNQAIADSVTALEGLRKP